MTANFLLRLSYILHTIGIENIYEKYCSLIVALKYLLEWFQVYNCGQRKLDYYRAQVTELKYIYSMQLRRINHFWI